MCYYAIMPLEKLTNYHHGDLKNTLLTHALEALEVGGLENLSLRDLAQSAGVSKTAPYRHFKDKQALLVEIAAEGFQLLADNLETAQGQQAHSPPSQDPLRGLKPALKAYVDFSRSRPELYKIMFSKIGYGLHSDRCKINANRAMGCLISSAVAAQAAGWKSKVPPTSLVLSLWSLGHGWASMLTEQLIPPELNFNPDQWIDSVLDLIQ